MSAARTPRAPGGPGPGPSALRGTLLAGLPRAGELLVAEAAARAAALAPPTTAAPTTTPLTTPLGRAAPRPAAVLVLFSPGAGSGDVLLIERAAGLRSHPGQVAFPGGGLEDVDGGDPVAAALREAREEAGLEPAGVGVLGVLPTLPVPPRATPVTPVVAWQDAPSAVLVADPGEVARVVRVPLAVLLDPASRHVARTARGWRGPAFTAGDLVVWGFTAVVLDALLRAAGLERDWERSRVLDVPDRFAGSARSRADAPLARERRAGGAA